MKRKKWKSLRKTGGITYMDGLVSTGNKLPNTILNIIFANKKIFLINFINIIFSPVDNRTSISFNLVNDFNEQYFFQEWFVRFKNHSHEMQCCQWFQQIGFLLFYFSKSWSMNLKIIDWCSDDKMKFYHDAICIRNIHDEMRIE